MATMPSTPSAPTTSSPVTPSAPTTSPTATPSAAHALLEPIEFATPPSDLDDTLDADHDDDVPARLRKFDNVLGPESSPGLAPRVLDCGELLFASAEELASFK
jgi:hypothetical protein